MSALHELETIRRRATDRGQRVENTERTVRTLVRTVSFLGRTMAQGVDFSSGLPANRTSIRTEKQVAVAFPTPAESATGWRKGVPETRFGLRHRTQLATRATAGGLSNFRALRVSEYVCFREDCAPLACADLS